MQWKILIEFITYMSCKASYEDRNVPWKPMNVKFRVKVLVWSNLLTLEILWPTISTAIAGKSRFIFCFLQVDPVPWPLGNMLITWTLDIGNFSFTPTISAYTAWKSALDFGLDAVCCLSQLRGRHWQVWKRGVSRTVYLQRILCLLAL